MKTHLIIMALLIFTCSMNAQVGIGLIDPDQSSILEIESDSAGILIPRMDTGDRNLIAFPANSLMIFNTDTNTYQYNSGISTAPIWINISSNDNPSIKYSNDITDTTIDVNGDTAVNLPVFGTLEWNDNTTLYTVDTSARTITINETGRYRLSINASLLSIIATNNTRVAPQMRIKIGATQVGTYAATGYMRKNNDHQETSLHINEIIEVTTGDIISVDIIRETTSESNDAVFLKNVGSSNIYIEKIK